ncbi:hypothetical protein, partial [Klebsiella pneumoniae]|uniref:hypothetical protein n=1 Tax=Klebsiella pneumoniae TaxID=573 RepID=UPI0019532A52
AKETPGKARLHTCVDQYNANKASNGNGGMKWIEKGGGYYSECNKKLKGAAGGGPADAMAGARLRPFVGLALAGSRAAFAGT